MADKSAQFAWRALHVDQVSEALALMTRYVVRRVVFMVVTLWCVVSVTFFLLRLAPGGPFDDQHRMPPEIEANLKASYHLDEALHQQYFRYLSQLVRLDFGPSFKQKDFSVNELIKAGLPVSLTLGAMALVFALVLGMSLGTVAAFHHNSWLDKSLSTSVTFGLAVPPIVVAPLLVLLFAVTLRWLPAGGTAGMRGFILPAIALGLPHSAAFAKLMRGSCIDVLKQPFVLTARAKGLAAWRVALRHVVPSASVPVLSFLGPASATLLAGSLVVEEVFALPGLGRYFVQGAINRDYTLVLGAVVVYALLLLILNFAVDLCYSKLDPRIRAPHKQPHV